MQLEPYHRILDAFWWEPSPDTSYILFVEPGGVHVVDIPRTAGARKKISISDVVRATFRVKTCQTESVMTVITQMATVLLNLQFVGGEVVVKSSTTSLPQLPTAVQFPLCRSDWVRSILAGSSVMFIQSDFKVALATAKTFAVIKHFLSRPRRPPDCAAPHPE
jgi:hypothetical protein